MMKLIFKLLATFPTGGYCGTLDCQTTALSRRECSYVQEAWRPYIAIETLSGQSRSNRSTCVLMKFVSQIQ